MTIETEIHIDGELYNIGGLHQFTVGLKWRPMVGDWMTFKDKSLPKWILEHSWKVWHVETIIHGYPLPQTLNIQLYHVETDE